MTCYAFAGTGIYPMKFYTEETIQKAFGTNYRILDLDFEPQSTRHQFMFDFLPESWQDEVRGNVDLFCSMPLPSKKPGLVEFYDTKAKRLVSSKAGRFLNRFGFDQCTIQKLAVDFEAACKPVEVLFTQDADTIERVYLNGPSSCMSKSFSYCHPSRVYAGPDLALAYSADLKYRCVVWPAKKLMGRIYGGDNRFKLALENLGYTNEGDFYGARLQKIPHPTFTDSLVVPYFDFSGALVVGKNYIEVSESGYNKSTVDSGETCGYSSIQYYCEKCRRKSYIRNDGECSNCYENSHFYCEISGEHCPNEDRVLLANDMWASASHPSVFYCRESRKWLSSLVPFNGRVWANHDGVAVDVTSTTVLFLSRYGDPYIIDDVSFDYRDRLHIRLARNGNWISLEDTSWTPGNDYTQELIAP